MAIFLGFNINTIGVGCNTLARKRLREKHTDLNHPTDKGFNYLTQKSRKSQKSFHLIACGENQRSLPTGKSKLYKI